MKFLLIVLALCSEPVPGEIACEDVGEAATVYTYPTFARCVQDREWFRTAANIEADCTGEPWQPPHAQRG